ncbi:MAG: UDP-N-acetylmuramate--L-alanine ligase [Candidatus Kapaibacteriota bacterium]
MNFNRVRNIHFVGIGGIGMSGIAEILVSQGFAVSGSDLQRSENTDHLERLGVRIMLGHHADNITNAEVVVYSSAVDPATNPETAAALERHLPVIRRAEMLSEVSRLKYTLAIAGTHGKTTTTSLCGLVMMQAGLDPTVIVGGRLKGLGGSNARLGRGDWIVLEADEYDRSFLQLLPTIAVITNVEADHLDIYSDLDDIKGAFVEFTNKVPFYGTACVCVDDAGVRDIIPSIHRRLVTYGLREGADVRGIDCAFHERSSQFTLTYHGEPLGTITINTPGEHNVRNALAACAVALECGIAVDDIATALASFSGVHRRFDIKGERSTIMVVDDYAHHPTEVRSALAAAKRGWHRRVVAVFQPHTYTRTRDFIEEFAVCFSDADVLIVTDIYAAREQPIKGVTGELIATAARAADHPDVHYAASLSDATHLVRTLTQPGDLVMTLGAGDVWKVGLDFLAE